MRWRVVVNRDNEHLGSSRFGAGGRFCGSMEGLANLWPGPLYAGGQHRVLLAAVSDAGMEALARAASFAVLIGLRGGALVDRSLYVQIRFLFCFHFLLLEHGTRQCVPDGAAVLCSPAITAYHTPYIQ